MNDFALRLVFYIEAKGNSDIAYWMNVEMYLNKKRRGIDHCIACSRL